MLRSFLRLSRRDRRLFASALIVVARVRVMLSFSSLDKTLRRLPSLEESAHSRGAPDEAARQIRDAVRRASRVVPGATCLTQAVAARAMLARLGYGSVLRFGIAKPSPEELHAHAWLESGGAVVIGDHGLGEYAPLKGRDEVARLPG